MSYAQMEAKLIEKIAQVRAFENSLLRSFDEVKSGREVGDMTARYRELCENLDEIEQLLSLMDSESSRFDPAPQVFARKPTLQFSSALSL